MREQVRYKLYIDHGQFIEQSLADGTNKFWTFAAYSKPCYVDRLNKINLERLRKMQSPDFPINKFVRDVGFKTPHKYDKEPVYVIDGTWAQAKSVEEGREQIFLRRVKPTIVKWYTDRWTDNRADAFLAITRNESACRCFADRMTKKERDKVMLLNMMEPNTYLEGVGAYTLRRAWLTDKGWITTDEKMYYLEM